ncbi:response regulator [Veillonella criceti]|uniref:Transcriptional regulatory protein YycF n=1 Tax=Veillonella criceti TaxID=103891 RepID=A0A380NMA1_9FIRM|nr:response regulator transcription factor [Veillonella criceti]SUP44329.1 Transcriptional regulatory protein YycF [Veillonella criceti]
MKQTHPLIYCVEDEDSIRGLISYVLNGQGFEVGTFESSSPFWAALEERRPQLVLLDIMLEGEDGLSILHKLRERPDTEDLPIIMITAKTSEIDVVQGLDGGADDYISKPFGVVELVSRIKALLRRTRPVAPPPKSTLTCGNLVLDKDSRIVTLDGQPISLTLKEYELLLYFMENTGIALSRERIMEVVWGFSYEGESRTVDMHVVTLRQHLGSAGRHLKTVRGIGYRWEASL